MIRLLLLLLLFLFLISCGSVSLPGKGEIAIIASKIPDGVLAARNDAAFEEMNRVSAAMDGVGLQNLIYSGDVVILSNNTAGLVTDIKFNAYKVRIKTGPYTDQEWIVSTRFIAAK